MSNFARGLTLNMWCFDGAGRDPVQIFLTRGEPAESEVFMKRAEIFEVEVFAHPTCYSLTNSIDTGFVIYTVHYVSGKTRVFRFNDWKRPPQTVQDFLHRTDLFVIPSYNGVINDYPERGIYTMSAFVTYSVCPF